MCYACNPQCGRCKPRRSVSVNCPVCKAVNSMRREEFLLLFELPHRKNALESKLLERGGVAEPTCALCGEALRDTFEAAVTPRECTRIGIVCGYPCGLVDQPPQSIEKCPFMVPLERI